VIDNQ